MEARAKPCPYEIDVRLLDDEPVRLGEGVGLVADGPQTLQVRSSAPALQQGAPRQQEEAWPPGAVAPKGAKVWGGYQRPVLVKPVSQGCAQLSGRESCDAGRVHSAVRVCDTE